MSALATGHVHGPVQTLANTVILFFRLRKEKRMQASLLFRTAPRRSASLSVSDASFPVISLIILKMAALFFLIFVLYNDATKAKELPE